MKFLIISQYAGSGRHGMVLRNYNWARALVQMGHEVTIVASDYSHSRRVNPKAGREVIEGINYIWLRGMKYDPAGKWGRVLSMLLYTVQVPFVKGVGRADVVVCSSPQPFAIYPARYWAKKFGAKLVFDVRDMWPMTLKYLGGLSGGHPFIKMMQAAEDYACRHADILAAVPSGAEEYFISRGLKQGRFLPVLNGVLDGTVHDDALPPEHVALLNDLRGQNAFIIGYAGAIGTANAMHVLVDALAHAPLRAHAVLMGKGPDVEVLKAQARALGVEGRLHFLPPVSHAQVDGFLQQVDCAYLGFYKSELYIYGASPTKLNDYMRVGVPIIYSHDEAQSPVDLSQGGIMCAAEDARAVGQAINDLSGVSKPELVQMGQNGRAWLLDNNTVQNHMERLLARLGA